MTHTDEQSLIRKEALTARRGMSDAQRYDYSIRIAARLERTPWFRSASTIAVYLSARDEADTSEIILRSWRANKRVVAPVIGKNSRMVFSELSPSTPLKRNNFGLLEPASNRIVVTRDINIVVTPLAAFDKNGARVGMGGGYFDRHFSQHAFRRSYRHPRLIGVAFACQQVKQIPENPWDISLSACVTEEEAIAF